MQLFHSVHFPQEVPDVKTFADVIHKYPLTHHNEYEIPCQVVDAFIYQHQEWKKYYPKKYNKELKKITINPAY